MKQEDCHDTLLSRLRDVYCAHPDMTAFAPFPEHVTPQQVRSRFRSVCDMMRNDPDLRSIAYTDAMRAIQDAGPTMHWRETYKEDAEGAGFMDRLGCYAVIGNNSPFTSPSLRLFALYMPAGLYYPSHRHPAEEIYLVLAGRARFWRDGAPDQILSEGEAVFHASNQAHGTETTDSPVLCLVAWRNHFDVLPVLATDTDG